MTSRPPKQEESIWSKEELLKDPRSQPFVGYPINKADEKSINYLFFGAKIFVGTLCLFIVLFSIYTLIRH